MTPYSPREGSLVANVVAIVRKQNPEWVSAVAIKRDLGLNYKITNSLAPAIENGLLEVQVTHGRAYYRLAQPKPATHRFQLTPVWPPGFVSRWDEPARQQR